MAWEVEAAVGLCQNWGLLEMASFGLLSLRPEHCSWESSPPSASCPSLGYECDSESALDSNSAVHPILGCNSSRLRTSPGIFALQVDERTSCPSQLAKVVGKYDNGWLNACEVVCIPDIATEHCLSLWLR